MGTQVTADRGRGGQAGTQAQVRETRAPVEQAGPRGMGELCGATKKLEGRSCSERPNRLF